MRAVVQRVKDAAVSVNGQMYGRIASGLLVYLGVAQGDSEADAGYIAEKITGLRIFEDAQGKMNLSLKDFFLKNSGQSKAVLGVSQFTLLGDARKGRRPSYSEAALPETAKGLYEYCLEKIREQGIPCEAGVFQAHMEVTYTNDGPVTILLDSRKSF
ncbi:MAG: D-tyrosyl-tRNA(Tyr) deacylase [Spirochaetaceae bacterium]|jgi:D-tyrosyl-tRNA(Tyr) deacylase|nr:D-tyrosyl-tRNA(Tyr) deacylase [Spirochaetaceae bacterium]